MLNKTKTDPELGQKVFEFLKEKGVETPMINNDISEEDKISIIEKNIKSTLETLGLDLTDDSLIKTPNRVAKMYVNEIFWGLNYDNFPRVMTFNNKMDYDQMIVEKNIRFYSDCEHHIRPISGLCHVAWLPNEKVPGLSKINRIVEFFSRRPQVQERLVTQIYWTLNYILQTDDIAVIMSGEHFCVKQRGVEDHESDTITSKLGGVFRTSDARHELLQLIKI